MPLVPLEDLGEGCPASTQCGQPLQTAPCAHRVPGDLGSPPPGGWEGRAPAQAELRGGCEINKSCGTSASSERPGRLRRGRAGVPQTPEEEWETVSPQGPLYGNSCGKHGCGEAPGFRRGASASPPPSLLRSSLTALRLPCARGLRLLRLHQRTPGCAQAVSSEGKWKTAQF